MALAIEPAARHASLDVDITARPGLRWRGITLASRRRRRCCAASRAGPLAKARA